MGWPPVPGDSFFFTGGGSSGLLDVRCLLEYLGVGEVTVGAGGGVIGGRKPLDPFE